jgi:hypothetical protein
MAYSTVTISGNTPSPQTCSLLSAPVLVTVNNLDSGAIALAQTLCEGETPAAFSSSRDATGEGSMAYQWQSSDNGVGYSNISGATGSTYAEPSALTADKWYRRVATSTLNSVACLKYSVAIKITVNNLSQTTILSSQTICEGTTAALTGPVPTIYDGTLTYQWESSTDFTNWNPISGGTSLNYTTTALSVNTWYRRVVTSTLTVEPAAAKACSKTSEPILVTVNHILSPGSIAGPQTICENDVPAAFTSVAATADGAITYQWQKNTGSGYSNITGATDATYQAPALTVDTWYQRIVISTLNTTACSATSNDVKITVVNFDPEPLLPRRPFVKASFPQDLQARRLLQVMVYLPTSGR